MSQSLTRNSQGRYVYEPESDHHPTVTNGDACVIYPLPGGATKFTEK